MQVIKNKTKVKPYISTICKSLIISGNTLTFIGCLALLFGLFGLIKMDAFSYGISSGIRVIGTVAIAGCLLSAIGYGSLDYIDKQ
jgi:uncharacterized membrane-anchored protein